MFTGRRIAVAAITLLGSLIMSWIKPDAFGFTVAGILALVGVLGLTWPWLSELHWSPDVRHGRATLFRLLMDLMKIRSATRKTLGVVPIGRGANFDADATLRAYQTFYDDVLPTYLAWRERAVTSLAAVLRAPELVKVDLPECDARSVHSAASRAAWLGLLDRQIDQLKAQRDNLEGWMLAPRKKGD